MRIRHINGGFWNEDNNCFGHAREATSYEFVENMPVSMDDNAGTKLERVIYSDDCVKYYPFNDYNSEDLASAES